MPAGPPRNASLPPEPTPADLTKLASSVEADRDPSPHATACVKHLRAAAHILSTGDDAGALRVLRAAQTDLAALTRDHQLAARQASAKVNGVGFGSAVPPAEQSSARPEMMRHVSGASTAMARNVQVAKHIDAIRRRHSHGTIWTGQAPAH